MNETLPTRRLDRNICRIDQAYNLNYFFSQCVFGDTPRRAGLSGVGQPGRSLLPVAVGRVMSVHLRWCVDVRSRRKSVERLDTFENTHYSCLTRSLDGATDAHNTEVKPNNPLGVSVRLYKHVHVSCNEAKLFTRKYRDVRISI